MKYTSIIFFLTFLSINTFAQDTEVKGTSLCFGDKVWGSNGERDACDATAAAINSLSTDSLKTNARCIDVRSNTEERLNSGCIRAAFIVKSRISIDQAQAAVEKKTVSYSCEEYQNSDGSEAWTTSCLNGTSTFAVNAKNCAVQTVVTLCLEKGLSNCTPEKATTKYKYYFSHGPRCIATAIIRN